MLKVDKFID